MFWALKKSQSFFTLGITNQNVLGRVVSESNLSVTLSTLAAIALWTVRCLRNHHLRTTTDGDRSSTAPESVKIQ